MVDSTDGWAVGSAATKIRWNGTSWNFVDDPITYLEEFPNGNVVEMTLNKPLESVDMISSTDGWAVGWRGTIIHWNGTSWNLVDSPEIFEYRTIWSVDMFSPTDGWAVGDGGRIIHWDGTSWENVTSPNTKHLFSVDMINSIDGWAVGSDGCIIHWNVTSWKNMTSPTTAWLNSIDIISSSDGWIVGVDGNIYHWHEEVTSSILSDYILIAASVAFVVLVFLFLLRERSLKQEMDRTTV
jgi:predicted membrane protein